MSRPLLSSAPIYDREWLEPGQQRLRFFVTPCGSMPAWAPVTRPKTWADTSMFRSSTLPDPESMDVERVRLSFDADAPRAAVEAVLRSGRLEFSASGGQVVAWRAPTWRRLRWTKQLRGISFTVWPAIELAINEYFYVEWHGEAIAHPIRLRVELEGVHYLVDVIGDEGSVRRWPNAGQVGSQQRRRTMNGDADTQDRKLEVARRRLIRFVTTRFERITALAHGDEPRSSEKIAAQAQEALREIEGSHALRAGR